MSDTASGHTLPVGTDELSGGVAAAASLLCTAWTLPLLHELADGPKRFGQIRERLASISANVLTRRLAELEAEGLVIRFKLPPPAAVQVYGLTEDARSLVPIIATLGRWQLARPRAGPTSGRRWRRVAGAVEP